MAKDRLYEYLKRTPENSNVSVVKALMKSGSLDDYLTKEEAEETYVKKDEISQYIDTEEIVEKVETELDLSSYVKKTELEEELTPIKDDLSDAKDELQALAGRVNNFEPKESSEEGTLEKWAYDFNQGVVDAYEEVKDDMLSITNVLTQIYTQELPKINTKLDKADSYDLRFDVWFKGETSESEQSHEVDPYANPVWEYKFWPSFRPVLGGSILDNTSNELLKVSNDEQRSFKLYFTVDGIDLVADCYNSEGPDNVGYSAFVDWSAVSDHSQWLEKLDLDLSALVSSIDEHGAHCDVSNVFKGAVLQVVDTAEVSEEIENIEDRLDNLQLVRNYYKVIADGVNHEFIIANTDVTNHTIQNVYINGVKDFDSTVVTKSALGTVASFVHIREDNGGTLVPLVLDAGDKIVVETLALQ